MDKFKVGDKVKVIDVEETYTYFKEWTIINAPRYAKEWKWGEKPNTYDEYIIMAKSSNEFRDRYLIQSVETKQVYIMDEKGIKLVKEIETFFKKLPNDYTGTIEIENGFVIKQKKEILDKIEKKYLENLLRPFKNKVETIRKCVYVNTEYLRFEMKYGVDNFDLPTFEANTMYKGMEQGKYYTLKELGLFESKKK